MHQLQTSDQLTIKMVENPDQLRDMVRELGKASEIAFDTEYDSFKREYGFKLLLIQIFDGKTIFIVDPLKLQDISPLWSILEDPGICKVVYAGSEDIALMKALGCQVKNIFDVQVAATLTNQVARNLGDLIATITGNPADKSQQKSDWRVRPLTSQQTEYAANDVVHLLELKRDMTILVSERDLMNILTEENDALEEVHEREHIPRLKPIFYKTHSESYCDALLAMILLRDRIAREMNLPPVRVVDTRYLEDTLNNHEQFLADQEFRSFHPKIRNSSALKAEFIQIIGEYDPLNTQRKKRQINPELINRRPILTKEQQQEILLEKYEPIKNEYIARYGERAAEFLLRGLKKDLIAPEGPTKELKRYQLALLDRMRNN